MPAAVAKPRASRDPIDPGKKAKLGLFAGSGASGFGTAIASGEFLHATRRIYELLFTREKRMASRANADFNIPLGGTGVVNSTARTGYVGFVILWMDARFHGSKRVVNLGMLRSPRKR